MKNTTNTTHDIPIIHIMKDGEVRNSIDGLTVPPETGCYDILKNIIQREEERRETA